MARSEAEVERLRGENDKLAAEVAGLKEDLSKAGDVNRVTMERQAFLMRGEELARLREERDSFSVVIDELSRVNRGLILEREMLREERDALAAALDEAVVAAVEARDGFSQGEEDRLNGLATHARDILAAHDAEVRRPLEERIAALEKKRSALVAALVAAESALCASGGPGCICGCSVVDGHTKDCPIIAEISARDAEQRRAGAVAALRKAIEIFHQTEWYSMSDDCIASNRCVELIDRIESGEVTI